MLEINVNIVLAAGTQSRWNHEPIPGLPKIKQLVKVKGQVLIDRIQEQFPGSIVITKDNVISFHCSRVFKPEFNGCTIETLFSTHSLWKDWTTILLGDVDYGSHTILKINKQKEPLMFYGVKDEIFAVKWNKTISPKILLCINKLSNHPLWSRKFGKLWNLYRTLNGNDFRVHEIDKFFTFVSDCRDFDTQKSYQKYAEKQKVRK